MIENKEVAGWIAGVQARGVTLAVRNGRLWLQPASAYKQLTDDELLTLRRCRQEIKDAVAFGVAPATATSPPPEPAPVPKPAPLPPKREIPEHIRRIVEWNTPAERKRRDAEATKEMMFQIGKGSPYL